MDVNKKWNIDGFHLHVCNPPFEYIENGVRSALNKNLWSEGHHPNRNGHKRIAKELFDFIKSNKLI